MGYTVEHKLTKQRIRVPHEASLKAFLIQKGIEPTEDQLLKFQADNGRELAEAELHDYLVTGMWRDVTNIDEKYPEQYVVEPVTSADCVDCAEKAYRSPKGRKLPKGVIESGA